MYGSSIDFVEVWFFSFEDDSSINPDILQKKAYFGTRHRFSYQMFELAAFCPFSFFQTPKQFGLTIELKINRLNLNL